MDCSFEMNFLMIVLIYFVEDNVIFLEKWNNKIFEKYFLNIVLIFVGLMIGILGNVVVIFIYRCFVNK